MNDILFVICILLTIAVWIAEDRVEKAVKKISKGWTQAMEVALLTESPSMPEFSTDEIKKHRNLNIFGWILWILKGVLYVADLVFAILVFG